MIARVGGSWHDRVSSGCYRVLAIRAVSAAADDATPSRSGRGEERQKDSREEDNQAKQNARIQEGRLTCAFLFHDVGLLRSAPILGSVAKESRAFSFSLLSGHADASDGLFPRGRLCPSRPLPTGDQRACAWSASTSARASSVIFSNSGQGR